MLKPKDKELNFIERKRAWKSSLDKPIGPSLLVTLLPALVMCAFLVLAAPYLKGLAMKLIGEEKEDLRAVDTAEDAAPRTPTAPPPDPQQQVARFYQEFYDKQGFDWRQKPELEIAEEEVAAPEVEIEPIEVDLSSLRPTLGGLKHAPSSSE